MNDTATVRIGQVWADANDHRALVTTVAGGYAAVRYVNGPREGHVEHPVANGLPNRWRLHSENARLSCADHTAALDAAKFLTGHGLRDVLVDGAGVSAPLTVMSVMQFADDALANGWADDHECARMIGDLG
jgi:hypothetical protein